MKVSIAKILVGQQAGFSLEKWVEISNEYNRISLPITKSPYVTFLEETNKNKRLLENDSYLENSDYFKMGMVCINTVGHFMGAKNKEQLMDWMRNYYRVYVNKKGNKKGEIKNSMGHSKEGSPILLKKIKLSDSYEIIDGHHRIAIDYFLGKKFIEAIVLGEKYSILQKKLLKINQINDIELYQPIDRLEVKSWPFVRNCKDRYNMMVSLLKKENIKKGNMIDLACSYGWFPFNFKKKGFGVFGVDRDKKAIGIAKIVYNLKDNEIEIIKIEDFFKKNTKRYDIVLFLSILHHYAIGKEKGKVEEILNKLDKITKKVLFLDTGQNHEKWFMKKLSNWNEEYIIKLIKDNTSFKKVIPLGKDKDNKRKYKGNYQRTLFACIK